MHFTDLTFQAHAVAILEILNDAILHSTSLYDYTPRTLEHMQRWFQAKQAGDFPIVGAVADDVLLGFASYGTFRAWPAYKYTVEHSVYVHPDHRGCRVGLAVMTELIERAKSQQYHVMIGGIDADNSTSIALHKRLGFSHSGTIQHAGFKFGRWLDLAFYQLILETPTTPMDG